MHICAFSRQILSQDVRGGMEIHGRLLSEGLVRKGCRVTVITTRHPDGRKQEDINGVQIYYLENTIFGSRRDGWPRESVKKFIQINKEIPIDIVWSQSFDAYGLATIRTSKLRIPIIPVLQGCIHQEVITFMVKVTKAHKKPIKILRSFAGLFFSYFVVQKRLLAFADVVITPSYQVPGDIKRWFGKSASEKCVTVFNGIDTKHFHPNSEFYQAVRNKYNIDAKTVLLLSAGRLINEKGHQVAIDVLARVKKQVGNVKLMIVGDGENYTDFKDQVCDNGLEDDVIFTGFIENKDTVQYYNSCDIFLMPTLREEGLPFVLIEIMACQKPSVVSKIGGNISVIDDYRDGILADPGSVNDMAEKVLLLIDNNTLADEIARCARRTVVNKFSVGKMVNQTFNIFEACKNKLPRQ